MSTDRPDTPAENIGCVLGIVAVLLLATVAFLGFQEERGRDGAYSAACILEGGSPLVNTEIGNLCIRDARLIKVEP